MVNQTSLLQIQLDDTITNHKSSLSDLKHSHEILKLNEGKHFIHLNIALALIRC